MSIHERSDQSAKFLQGAGIHSQWESDYLNPRMDEFYDKAFADIVERIPIKPSDSILDAGCGYCFHTARLARSGAQITAVDFSEAALAAAADTIRQRGLEKQVTLRQADLTKLPFADASFDHVVCWGVLMHIPDMEKALDELVRVLRPGGTLVLSENNMRAPDIAVRERAIRLVKRVTGRETADVRRTAHGLEIWTSTQDGGLMVRKTDMGFLKRAMADRGMQQTGRMAGQLTEAYTNMPLRALKRAVYALNMFYFRFIGLPQVAAGNIVYFRKL